jgi:Tfp pilus assembly protein PilE
MAYNFSYPPTFLFTYQLIVKKYSIRFVFKVRSCSVFMIPLFSDAVSRSFSESDIEGRISFNSARMWQLLSFANRLFYLQSSVFGRQAELNAIVLFRNNSTIISRNIFVTRSAGVMECWVLQKTLNPNYRRNNMISISMFP